MRVDEVVIRNFRNHDETRLQFGGGINVLMGDNGHGKTNVLEAISYLGLTKSFFSNGDVGALQIGKDAFEIDGVIVAQSGTENRVRVCYSKSTGEKHVTLNGMQLERAAELIGRFPTVLLSPEGGYITTGPPAERRKFLDLVLSQLSRIYFEDLLQYRRVLKQRNRILAEVRAGAPLDYEQIEVWTANLVLFGTRLIQRRREFVTEFTPHLTEAYRSLSNGDESAELLYKTFEEVAPPFTTEALEAAVRASRDEEMRRGITLVGPHRDDLLMSLSGRSLQQYASQGQHKTFLVAMKVAEYEYLHEHCNEMPMLLLDDLFGELDAARSRRIVDVVVDKGQSIITSTADAPFGGMQWNGHNRRFLVENGTCRSN